MLILNKALLNLPVDFRSSGGSGASHSLGCAEAHPAGEGCGRNGAGVIVIVDGVLVNRIRVGGHAGAAQESRGGGRGSARKAERRDGKSPALVGGGARSQGRGERRG